MNDRESEPWKGSRRRKRLEKHPISLQYDELKRWSFIGIVLAFLPGTRRVGAGGRRGGRSGTGVLLAGERGRQDLPQRLQGQEKRGSALLRPRLHPGLNGAALLRAGGAPDVRCA